MAAKYVFFRYFLPRTRNAKPRQRRLRQMPLRTMTPNAERLAQNAERLRRKAEHVRGKASTAPGGQGYRAERRTRRPPERKRARRHGTMKPNAERLTRRGKQQGAMGGKDADWRTLNAESPRSCLRRRCQQRSYKKPSRDMRTSSPVDGYGIKVARRPRLRRRSRAGNAEARPFKA